MRDQQSRCCERRRLEREQTAEDINSGRRREMGLAKSHYQGQVVQIRRQAIYHQRKVMTLKPTDVTRGPATTLAVVKDDIEKMKKPR